MLELKSLKIGRSRNGSLFLLDRNTGKPLARIKVAEKAPSVVESLKATSDALRKAATISSAIAGASSATAAIGEMGFSSPVIRLNSLPLEKQLLLLSKNPYLVRFIRPSNEAAWEYALSQKPHLISLNRSPTERVQLAAVRTDGLALRYIQHELRTDRVRVAAIKQNAQAIDYVRGPNEELRSLAQSLSKDTTRQIRHTRTTQLDR